MTSLVVKSLEMWDKCSSPGVILNFNNSTSFLHHIWREDTMNQTSNIYLKNLEILSFSLAFLGEIML